MSSKSPPHDLQLLVITGNASADTAGVISCLPPIRKEILTNFQSLKVHVNDRSHQCAFIALFLDPNDQHHQPELEDLKQTKPIIACFFCIKFPSEFIYRGDNVFPVSKQFLYRELRNCIIKFLEDRSRNLLKSNDISLGFILQKEANRIKALPYPDQKLVLDILLIPTNVNDDQLRDHRERISGLCNDLCKDHQSIVGSLSDVFPWNEDPHTYDDKTIALMCNFIKESSSIRCYLLGDKRENLHPFSKKLLESESNQISTEEYNNNCTFISCEPLINQTRQNLSNLFGSRWESGNMPLKTLNDLREDLQFAGALEHAHVTHLNRITKAEYRMSSSADNLADNSVEISAQVGQEYLDKPSFSNQFF